MILDHSFGTATLSRHAVEWPGDADRARAWIHRLHGHWRDAVVRLSEDDLRSTARTRWPYRDRPFGDAIAWVNVELTKNAAEIGYARFLYAAR